MDINCCYVYSRRLHEVQHNFKHFVWTEGRTTRELTFSGDAYPFPNKLSKKSLDQTVCVRGGGVMLIWLIFPYKTLLGFLINPWNRKSHQMIFRPPYIMLIRDFIPVLSNNHDNDPSSPQKERKLIWNEVIYTFIRQSWIDDTCA